MAVPASTRFPCAAGPTRESRAGGWKLPAGVEPTAADTTPQSDSGAHRACCPPAPADTFLWVGLRAWARPSDRPLRLQSWG